MDEKFLQFIQNTYWELDSSDIQYYIETSFDCPQGYDVVKEQKWLNHHAYTFDARPDLLTEETRNQYLQDAEGFVSGVPFRNDKGEPDTYPLDSLLLDLVERGILPSGLYLITACF